MPRGRARPGQLCRPMIGSRTVQGITGAGRPVRIVAHWRDTSRHACDTSAFSPRFPCRFRGWCRVPNWDSARSRFRELRWGITSVLRPDTGQRDSRPVAHSGLKPRDQPAAALAESTLPKLHKISVVETWRRSPYAFHLLRLVQERGKSFSYYKHIVWCTTSALRSRTRNDVVPILSV